MKRVVLLLAGATLLAGCEKGGDDASWCESMKNTPQDQWSAEDTRRFSDECGAVPGATGEESPAAPDAEAAPADEAAMPDEAATPPSEEPAEESEKEAPPPPDGN